VSDLDKGERGQMSERVVIVTGGGRGIGRALASGLATRGARVVIADNGSEMDGSGTDESIATSAAAEIVRSGGEAVGFEVDVSDETAVELLLKESISIWGAVDAVVNAAGNFRLGTILSMNLEDWDAISAVHVRGPLLTTRAAARWWIAEGRSGRILNFTSAAGTNGIPNLAAYATAKAGVIGLTMATANALSGSRITANAISPNAASRMAAAGIAASLTDPDHVPDLTDPTLAASNLVPLVAFLTSEAAGGISGRVITNHGSTYSLLDIPANEGAAIEGTATDDAYVAWLS
jgi:NAD(P)-dependent dehydrogenase (short-subunit alcohol dehydrogenase family)